MSALVMTAQFEGLAHLELPLLEFVSQLLDAFGLHLAGECDRRVQIRRFLRRRVVRDCAAERECGHEEPNADGGESGYPGGHDSSNYTWIVLRVARTDETS